MKKKHRPKQKVARREKRAYIDDLCEAFQHHIMAECRITASNLSAE
jgi:hypothetical protein